MPPRIRAAVANSAFNLSSLFQMLPSSISKHPESLTKCSACLFSTSPITQSIRKKKTRRRVDPYRVAQANQRKAANLEKQKMLRAERQAAMGDPIRSQPTSFIETLTGATTTSSQFQYLNFFLRPDDVNTQLSHSKWLTEPLPKPSESQDPQELEARHKQHETEHENAARAIAAIAALENSSSKDRTRVNILRCIDEFGRHNTDSILPPKPASAGQSSSKPALLDDASISPESEAAANVAARLAAIPKRAGPDTGSSEVQVAILTAKINVLADNLGKKDKHNKRNLRLLVHRRQKLLSYLRRKERGGPRWQHLVEKLGIGDAMWKGEISL